MQSILSRAVNDKLLVIEDGGMPILCGLKVNDPMRPNGCIFGNPECIVRNDINCDKTGVVYRIECETCISTSQNPRNVYNYIGMT